MTKFIVLLGLVGAMAHSEVGRNIVLKGRIESNDGKVAVLVNDQGRVSVPASSVDSHNAKGEWVAVMVDIVDVLRLNKKELAKLK